MEVFEETLESDISVQLPTISGQDVQELLEKILEVVDCIEDLPHVEPSDLQPPLKKATAKRFVSYLQTKYGDQGAPKKKVELQPTTSMDQLVKPTENKPKVPTKPTNKYPKIPPKPKASVPSPRGSPRAVRPPDTHSTSHTARFPSLSSDISGELITTAGPQSTEVSSKNGSSTNYEADIEDSDTHYDDDVESNERAPVTLHMNITEMSDDVGLTKPPMNYPNIPPKVFPKPKLNMQEFDSHQNNDVKSNVKARDTLRTTMKDVAVDVTASIATKHRQNQTNYEQESSNNIQEQSKDSSAVKPDNLRETVDSPPSSPAHKIKKGLMRPCVPPPSIPSKQGSNSVLDGSSAAKHSDRAMMKPGPNNTTLDMSELKLKLGERTYESQGSVSIEETNQKLPPCKSFSAEQKGYLSKSHDAHEEERLSSGESPKPLGYIKSLSVEHIDLVSKGKRLGKLRTSSDGCEQSSTEPEKGQKIDKGSVFDKLRKFTFSLLSSDKADGDVGNNDQPTPVEKQAEGKPLNSTGKIPFDSNNDKSDINVEDISTTENLLENPVYEECGSPSSHTSAGSDNELYDDVVISRNEKSSNDEICTTKSLPGLPVQDECGSPSTVRTAHSENALHADYVNFPQIQSMDRQSDRNVLVVSPDLPPQSVYKPQVNNNSIYANEEVEEQQLTDKHLFTRETNNSIVGEMNWGSENFDEFDSDEIESDSFDDDNGEEMKEDETPTAEKQARKTFKRQQIATEMLTTERAYVKRLHLIDQVFYFEALNSNRSHHMFPDDVIPQMFSNIKSIYEFHNDFLLPQLEKRMADWDKTPKIGDLMSEHSAPFLKMYSEYVKNFDHAIRTINKWQQRSPKFAELLADFQKKPACGRLSIQDHMLEPIQRVPRYQLLLKDYLRHLEENSEDHPDTEKALELVSTTASQANQAMVKPEKYQQLLELNPMFGGVVDLTDRPRELITEGQIFKVSARNGALFARYIFLFTDMLLVCTGGRMQGSFHLHNLLKVDSMQVLEGDNPETPFTFYVVTNAKTVELHSRSQEEKLKWFSTIESVVGEHKELHMLQQSTEKETRLGHCAPRWVKDQKTSECMMCASVFSIIKRRHHCRCCGIVVCAECSSHKAPLAYQDNKPDRVCDNCYEALKLQNDELPVTDSSVVCSECSTSPTLCSCEDKN